MLVELSVVEQRYSAVRDVIGGLSVSEVARMNGVTRQTVHRWLRRYANDGMAGLVNTSNKPDCGFSSLPSIAVPRHARPRCRRVRDPGAQHPKALSRRRPPRRDARCENGVVNRIGVTRCLLAAILFGASAPAASKLAGDVPTLVLAGLLYLGAGLAVLPAVLRRPPTRQALQRDWRPALVAVIAGGAVGPALLVAGLARTSAATASILLNLELAATVLLAATIFREHLGRRVAMGAALVTGAGMILVWEPGAEVSVGALLIAAACVAWGIDNGVTAKIDQLGPEHVVLLKGAIAGAANLMLGLAFADDITGISAGAVVAALAVGAAGYGASIVLWVKGARDLGAARGQLIFATAPFIGVLIAWVALGEAVAWVQLVAVALAAAGVAMSIESAHEHGHRHEPVEHEHNDDHHDHHHDVPAQARHTHQHRHVERTHAHPHVPDLHHRHPHDH